MLWCEDALSAFKTRNMRFRRGTGAIAAALLLPLTCAGVLLEREQPTVVQCNARDSRSCDFTGTVSILDASAGLRGHWSSCGILWNGS